MTDTSPIEEEKVGNEAAKESPKIRELFIEELVEVQAGADLGSLDTTMTTLMCCEELLKPDSCCL